MAYLNLKANYLRFGELKLLSSIKVNLPNASWFYLKPADQFICGHLSKFQNLPDFKRRHQRILKLDSDEFPGYYDYATGRLIFNGYDLLSECEYDLLHRANETEIFEFHRNCSVCTANFQPKRSIRKRERVDSQVIADIVHDVATGVRYADIQLEYRVSSTTIKNINSARRNKQLSGRGRRRVYDTRAISDEEKAKIIKLAEDEPFTKLVDIKRRLQLSASMWAIRCFLKRNGLSLHTPIERPYLYAHHVEARDRFANLVHGLDQDIVNRIVFTDEKTIYNVHSGKVKVIRKRGHGFDRK